MIQVNELMKSLERRFEVSIRCRLHTFQSSPSATTTYQVEQQTFLEKCTANCAFLESEPSNTMTSKLLSNL